MPKTSSSNTTEYLVSPFGRLSIVAFAGAALLFSISLLLPVFITENNDIKGYWVLAAGWLGFVGFQFAWYASPLAILAVHRCRHNPQMGLMLSVAAILVASQAFLFTEVPFGRNDKVLDYDLGFYVWYLSFYLVGFGVLMRVVEWGSVTEEQEQGDGLHKKRNISATTSQNHAVQNVRTARKVIKKISDTQNSRPTIRQTNWQVKTPPPLPKKNIYQPQPKLVAAGAGKPAQAESKHDAAMPPPLPRRRENGCEQPPPLPSSAVVPTSTPRFRYGSIRGVNPQNPNRG